MSPAPEKANNLGKFSILGLRRLTKLVLEIIRGCTSGDKLNRQRADRKDEHSSLGLSSGVV